MKKNIDKKSCFYGLDGTSAMSSEKKALQRCVRHVSPFAVYTGLPANLEIRKKSENQILSQIVREKEQWPSS